MASQDEQQGRKLSEGSSLLVPGSWAQPRGSRDAREERQPPALHRLSHHISLLERTTLGPGAALLVTFILNTPEYTCSSRRKFTWLNGFSTFLWHVKHGTYSEVPICGGHTPGILICLLSLFVDFGEVSRPFLCQAGCLI